MVKISNKNTKWKQIHIFIKVLDTMLTYKNYKYNIPAYQKDDSCLLHRN